MLSVCQCPLCPKFCSYYVASIVCKRTGYKRTGPAFSDSLPASQFTVCTSRFTRPQPNLVLRPERPFTGVSSPSGPEIPKNSQKSLPGPPGPECLKRLEKRVEKSQKSVKKRLFRDFLTLFEPFQTLRAGRPRETFLRLFGDFGRGGPGDYCKWPFGSQILSSSCPTGSPTTRSTGCRFDAKLSIATGACTTPIIEIFPPLAKTPLWKASHFTVCTSRLTRPQSNLVVILSNWVPDDSLYRLPIN